MVYILLQGNSGALPINLIFMGLLLGVMYFFFIRPQAKKQKEQIQFENDLSKGDKIVTTSGIIGTITKMDEKFVTLQISQKGVIDILKTSISKELTESFEK